MAIVVIGSRALSHHIPDSRAPSFDIDMFGTIEDFTKYVKIVEADRKSPLKAVRYTKDGSKVYAFFQDQFVLECEIAWPNSLTEELMNFAMQQPGSTVNIVGGMPVWTPHLDFLYMLKMSHRYKKNSPHFYKTMKDIQAMRAANAAITEELETIYKKRMKETYNYGHPNLKQSKKDFFTDDVPYKYDHDSIHKAIAFLDAPAYSKVKDVQDEVYMKKENFFDASEDIQLLCTVEESMVLSLERSIIPFDLFDDRLACGRAFMTALMKVCTSITSGWFREYSWENYDAAVNIWLADNQAYVERFKKGLDSGLVTPYTKPNY